MKRKTIYISYATNDYIDRMKNLYHSLVNVGIPKERIDFSTLNLEGDWFSRVKQKPYFIHCKCEAYAKSDINLAWIDADAEVVKFPIFFEEFEGDWGMAFEYDAQKNKRGWLANAFIININDKVKDFILKWDLFNRAVRSRTPNQASFKQAWSAYGDDCGFDITELPVSYTWYSKHKGRYPYNQVKPIIIHDIASRETIRKSRTSGY